MKNDIYDSIMKSETSSNAPTYWMMPSNSRKFDIHGFLEKYDTVDWKQRNNFAIGDIVILYCTAPESRVRYMFRVVKTDVTVSEYINDKDFWSDVQEYEDGLKCNRYVRLRLLAELGNSDDSLSLERLRGIGISQFQRASRITDRSCIEYIEAVFSGREDNDPDLLEPDGKSYYEGVLHQVTVNSYERDRKARQACISAHGTRCSVCGIDFGEMYGEIGRGFIHVHHTVPLNTIGKGYRVTPDTDLIPVCPNCHAMLHRGMDGEARSVEELKAALENMRSQYEKYL